MRWCGSLADSLRNCQLPEANASGDVSVKGQSRELLNRFAAPRQPSQTASTPVLGSGTLATRNPIAAVLVRRVDDGSGPRTARGRADVAERTTPQTPKRAANQGFVPLKNVAPHVDTRRRGCRAACTRPRRSDCPRRCCSSPNWASPSGRSRSGPCCCWSGTGNTGHLRCGAGS